jgi:catechol 2,3-dioxygenase
LETGPYPTRRDLAVALKRMIDAGVRIQGVADHGVSESIYLADPDGNGVELTRERPHDEWPRHADGSLRLAMADPLDVTGLISELG